MKKHFYIFVFFVFISSVLNNAFAWNPFKKQTFDECILENMKGVKSDSAAREITFACDSKTSNSVTGLKKCSTRFLTAAEEIFVTPYAIFESYGYMKLRVHNNNKNIAVTGFKVFITDLQTNKTLTYEVTYPKVEPLTTSAEILVKILYVPKKPTWNIYEITTEVCS